MKQTRTTFSARVVRPAGVLLLLLLLELPGAAVSFADVPLGLLPRNVLPLHYDLSLRILPSHIRFSGEVRIEIQIDTKLSSFWIHGKHLRVYRASLKLADGNEIPVRYVQRDAEEGVAEIVAARIIEPQHAVLSLSYDAPFDDQLEGLYRVSDDSHRYAFTQFETIYARQCFPSFDEPSFRTPFDITLTVPQSNAAISNMPSVLETPLGNGLKKVRFAQTPPLPTYLLEFAVGPFDVVNAPDIPASPLRNTAVPLRGIAAKGKGEKLKYALAKIPVFFQRLEDYFGIAYPFPKLDVIAVPDFDYGAMENAGAITFDEYELLLDNNPPVEQAREFAVTMTHELSHQWFGDLVTIRWWDDTWLNESFATWMETKIVDEWNPSYRSSLSALEYTMMAMRTDSLQAAHPLRMSVEHGSEAESVFDSIAYAKGGAVIAMVERYLGNKRFQQGIHHYLEKRRFTSATAEEFLSDFSEATDPGILKSFETFLYQPGVPLIEAMPDCSGSKPVVNLSQSRYLPLGSTAGTGTRWQIPVCVRYGADGGVKEQCTLLVESKSALELESNSCPEWILPNAEGAGYYRWNLSPEWYAKLESANVPLSLLEKLSMADSIQAALAAGKVPVKWALQSLAPFAASDERAVASVPMEVLRFLLDSLLSPESVPALRVYANKLYEEPYRRLGFDPKPSDDDNTRLLRNDVVEFLALVARNPEVRQQANLRAKAYLGYGTDGKLHPDAVDSNLLGAVLGVGLQENGAPFLDALLIQLKRSKDSAFREAVLTALGHAADPSLSPKILALTFDPALRTGEAEYPMIFEMRHPETRDIAWNWFRQNYDRIIRRIPSADLSYVPAFMRRFCTETKANEIKAFFEPRLDQLPGADDSLAASLESIQLCVSRVRAQSEDARAFFAGNTNETPGSQRSQR